MPTQSLLRPIEGSFRLKEGFCRSEGTLFRLERVLLWSMRKLFKPTQEPFGPKKDPLRSKEGPLNPIRGPLKPKICLPVNTRPSYFLGGRNVRLGRKIALQSWQRTLFGQQLVISQVGVALACIGVALFKVRIARATPKVYKSPPLGVATTLRGGGDSGSTSCPVDDVHRARITEDAGEWG